MRIQMLVLFGVGICLAGCGPGAAEYPGPPDPYYVGVYNRWELDCQWRNFGNGQLAEVNCESWMSEYPADGWVYSVTWRPKTKDGEPRELTHRNASAPGGVEESDGNGVKLNQLGLVKGSAKITFDLLSDDKPHSIEWEVSWCPELEPDCEITPERHFYFVHYGLGIYGQSNSVFYPARDQQPQSFTERYP